jgi:hypothetical protein
MTYRSPTKQPVATGLIDEMRLYLIAVDAFRDEGCEPHWSPLRELEIGVGPGLEAGGNLISIPDPRRHR